MTDSDPREKHSGAAPDFPCPTCGKARIMVGTLGLGLIFKPHDCAPSDPIDIIEERLRALADLVELVGLDDAPAEAFDVSRDTAERELIDTLDTAASLLHSLRAERDAMAEIGAKGMTQGYAHATDAEARADRAEAEIAQMKKELSEYRGAPEMSGGIAIPFSDRRQVGQLQRALAASRAENTRLRADYDLVNALLRRRDAERDALRAFAKRASRFPCEAPRPRKDCGKCITCEARALLSSPSEPRGEPTPDHRGHHTPEDRGQKWCYECNRPWCSGRAAPPAKEDQ